MPYRSFTPGDYKKMTVECEMNSLDLSLDSELVEIEQLEVADLLDFARYGEFETLSAILNSEHFHILASCDENKNSLLHMISANGHSECARLILENPLILEKLLNSVNAEGNTPLHWATMNSQTELVRVLLEFGADIHIKNSTDRTPFDEAAVKENFEITSLIIEHLEKSQEQQKEGSSQCNDDDDAVADSDISASIIEN
jgi:uncharacterized protein